MLERRAVALVSGRGSNLQAILDALSGGELRGFALVAVIADRPNIRALDVAAAAEIPVQVVDYRAFSDRAAFDHALHQAVQSFAPDFLLALGFMRLFSAPLVAEFRLRLINIHPSLLPAFPGIQAQRQALEYGAKIAGCTVHFVDEGVDSGPIIAQAAVAVQDGDTVESLSARILVEEHRILKEAISLFMDDRLQIEGRRVTKRL